MESTEVYKASSEIGGGTPGVQSAIYEVLHGNLEERIRLAAENGDPHLEDRLQEMRAGLETTYAETGRIDWNPELGPPILRNIGTHELRPGGPPAPLPNTALRPR